MGREGAGSVHAGSAGGEGGGWSWTDTVEIVNKAFIKLWFNLLQVETLAAPDPFYLMLPRLSYLPVVTDKVC